MISMEKIIELQARENLKDSISRFGLEGTEQKINEMYRLCPGAKTFMLEVLKKILRGE